MNGGHDDRVWYFAYGSNLDPERFRKRVGDWIERRRAVLPEYRLRFSADVMSEGGGGAVILSERGSSVHGAVFLITRTQLEAMDREEFARGRDVRGSASRIAVDLETESGALTAQVYTVPGTARFRPPSETYLGHILRGLRAVGHAGEILAAVRETAAEG